MRKKKKADLAPGEWQRRFNIAADVARREYCEIFGFWRSCRYKPCRRARKCSGDAKACLTCGIEQVSGAAQDEAAARIIASTPPGADRPTQTARRLPAFNLTT